ncbi:MAG: hypothetical protein IAE80_18835 [Anaerolinea sp.]|nr:hypothetical protein [Anaerolinea sp.]
MRWFRSVVLVGVALGCVTVAAQAETCADVVRQALATVQSACAETGRNEACYGNISIEAVPRADATDFTFEQQGDLVNVADVDTLTLDPLDADADEWGVALMQLQANLPDALPGQNVTFLLFGDVEIQNAVDTDADDMTPMQAFYFRTGFSGLSCEEAPPDGILIQTPEGAGTISLTMNDVDVQLGSTAFIQAEADADMVISVVEGQAQVTADGETVVVPEGAMVAVPLDEDLSAAGPPGEVEPYDDSALVTLPVTVLPRAIEVAVAADQDAIDEAQAMLGDMGDLGALGGMFDPGMFAGIDPAVFCAIFDQALAEAGMSRAEYLDAISEVSGMIPEADRAGFDEFIALLESCE